MKKKVQVYILGSGPAPSWCRDKLMLFQKKNGQLAYEFHGRTRDFDLNFGDMLILRGCNIEIVRGGGKIGCKVLPATDQHVR